MDDAYVYDPEKAPGFLISRTGMRMRLGLRRVFAEHGQDVTPEQWGVLLCLWRQEGLTQTELADRTVKDRTTITRILDLLEKKGLAERRKDPMDRRSFRVHLTDAGRGAREILLPLVKGYAARLYADLTEAEFTTLKSIMDKINARLDDLESEAAS
ncbi:MarR family winged helix-turn-helix transcriptional regulator [Desulfolutivibrio sulfoxidireducens]|uniref:MarR family winged helix-turn-helix transcriptional regulator n=1 Tax=Desulfolutivibrio sulfoxidireducens TaxID=2773299 RepID=UPI00159E2206|nr:MarR family transcriptional regulator [Desulfolutivibrio sulfoxidireducens]QLA15425.1 MarR family transcriptional regulator [Desulfolutivibrio sulfoxidireducens]QLA19023.1 MarR family transcriptional regulator [Desulfolutivibrio sulfoxidireducens]